MANKEVEFHFKNAAIANDNFDSSTISNCATKRAFTASRGTTEGWSHMQAKM